jgi:LysM repeat protein
MFISVWVIGCTVTHEIAPTITPTEYPQITLTVRMPKSSTPTSVAFLSPTTPTQSPSSTPEASPSPVVYVVQSGDTLLGIALAFGVELNALQAANLQIDPLALQIGQTLVIPQMGSTTALSIGPTPTPLALALYAPTCYEIQTGSLLCLGQIDNVLDEAVERVRVDVQLLAADGTLLAARAVDLDQRIIPPGKAAPYRVQFAPGDETDAGREVAASASLLRADAAAQVGQRFVELEVVDEGGAMSDGTYIVSATLVNSTELTADAIRLVVMLWDEQGRVTGYRVVQTGWSLAAGERRPLVVRVMPQACGRLPHIRRSGARRVKRGYPSPDSSTSRVIMSPGGTTIRSGMGLPASR